MTRVPALISGTVADLGAFRLWASTSTPIWHRKPSLRIWTFRWTTSTVREAARRFR